LRLLREISVQYRNGGDVDRVSGGRLQQIVIMNNLKIKITEFGAPAQSPSHCPVVVSPRQIRSSSFVQIAKTNTRIYSNI
jgi:hypothetical protein